MNITDELERIYCKLIRVRNITCYKIGGYFNVCSYCPYYSQYLDDCEFEDIMKAIKDLINVVDHLGIYRNKEKEDD